MNERFDSGKILSETTQKEKENEQKSKELLKKIEKGENVLMETSN